jgi:subtilase family serine protease
MGVAVRRRGITWCVPTAAAVLAAAAVAVAALAAADAAATGSRSSERHPVLSAIRIGLGLHKAKALPSALKCHPGSLPGDGVCLYGDAPAQLRTAYDLGPLYKMGISGAKQTIVIVDSFGSPTIKSDLAHFDKYFHLHAPRSFRVIQPAGRVPPYRARNSNGVGWAAETTLDVEWAHVMAPGASIVLVETPTSENEGTTGFPQIVTAEKYVLRQKLGQVISQSSSATEQTFSRKSDFAAIHNLRGAYKLAYKDHVTVVDATGDLGATSCKYNGRDEYTTPAVNWPATDPLVAAVGGTCLSLSADGAHKSPDAGWSGSGGGRSIVFGRPSYQDSVRRVTGRHRVSPISRWTPGAAVTVRRCISTAASTEATGTDGTWLAVQA